MLTVAVHFTSFGFHANTFTRTRIQELLDPKHGLCYKRYNSSLVTVHIYTVTTRRNLLQRRPNHVSIQQ